VLTPQGQDALRKAGLDPRQQYPELLAQAMREAQGQSRERVEEIARALVPSGGQFARIFVPLLRDQGLYNRVYGTLSPDQARGSATRELSHALAQPNEQIKQLGTGLEQIGVQLARLGAFDPFIAFVRGLNLVLDGVESLLGLLNQLPAPLRHLATIGLEVAAFQRVAQRYNLGGILPQQFGAARGALEQPIGRQIRNEALGGLDEYRAALNQQRFSVAGEAFRARYNESVARQIGDLEAAGNYQLRAEQLEGERVALEKEITATQTRRNVLAKELRGTMLRDPAAARAAVDRAGVPAVALATVPSTVAAETAERGALAANAARVNANITAMRESARGWARFGVAAELAGRTASAAAGVVQTAGTATVGMAAGLRNLARSAAAMIGWLDVLLVAALVVPQIIKGAADKANEADAKVRDAYSQGDLARLKQLGQRSRDPRDNHGLFGSIINADQTAIAFGARQVGINAESPDDRANRAAADARSEANFLRLQQRQGQHLPLTKVADRLNRAVRNAGSDVNAQIRAYERSLSEIGSSAEATSGDQQARARAQAALEGTRTKLAVLAASRHDIDRALSTITDAKGLQTFTDTVSARLQLGTTRPATALRQYAAVITRTRALLQQGRLNPAEALQAVAAAQKGVEDVAQQQLQRGLAGANSAGEQGQARGDFKAQLKAGLIAPLRRKIELLRRAIKADDEAINAALSEALAIQVQLSAPGARVTGADIGRARAAEGRVGDARKRKQADKSLLGALRDQLKSNRGLVDSLIGGTSGTEADQYQAQLQEFDARTKLLQSRTSDPKEQQRIAATRYKERAEIVRRAYKNGTASLADLMNAVADSNQSLQADTQSVIQEFGEKQQLAAARFGAGHVGQQGSVLRFAVAQAQQAVAFMRANGSASDVRGAQTALFNAQAALGEFLFQQAQEMIHARAEYDVAGITDPLRIAERRLREARDVYRQAPGRTPLDRLRQRTDIRTAQQQVIQTKAQDAYDTVEFEAQMGRITADQEVRRLRLIERTMHLTREMRRQIELRIHELQHQNDDQLELNVGNIRLPTLYDVRRLAAQAQGGGQTVIVRQTISNTNHIAKTADAEEVGNVLHRQVRNGVYAAIRKGGNR
jgi:hypothetical protein